jgi:SAM-dependent methyltransferase
VQLDLKRWLSSHDSPLKRVVPYSWRPAIRRYGLLPVDVAEAVLRKKPPSAPPRHLDNIGGGYQAIGAEFLSYFVEYAGLKPSDDVLDIGSGLGRMANALTGFLNDNGAYEGFDIVPESVRWCQEHITTEFPSFRFQLIEVQNPYYRQRQGEPAEKFTFPWSNGSFDFAFATSVFTHMLPDDVTNYIKETARVLRRGGRFFATILLLNDEVEQLSNSGRKELKKFKYRTQDYWAVSSSAPEALIALRERDVNLAMAKYNLSIDAIYYGAWAGRTNYVSAQDIFVCTKT